MPSSGTLDGTEAGLPNRHVEAGLQTACQHEPRGIHVGHAHRHVAGACRSGDGRQRERRVNATVELHQQGHTSEDAVGIGRCVEKSRSAGCVRQGRQVAHGTSGSKEGIVRSLVTTSNDGKPERVLRARARRSCGAIECQCIAQDHTARTKRISQRRVRGWSCAFVSVRFREDDVERDRRCSEIAQAVDQRANEVTTPRPLTDRRQTALVDVHNDDPAARRSGR